MYQQIYRLCHYILHPVAHIDCSVPSGKQRESLTGVWGIISAAAPRGCLLYFRAKRWSQLPISRPRDFTRFGGKTSYRLVNRGSGQCKTCQCQPINSLWLSDAIWRHISWLTLVIEVIACSLMLPSHYRGKCWLIISEVLWHSHENNFTINDQDIS